MAGLNRQLLRKRPILTMPEVRKVFTLAANNNQLSLMLAAVSTKIGMNLTWLRWKVVSGGPVAKGDSAMAALADGDSRATTDDPAPEQAFGTDRIDATLVYFRPTAGGDKIFVEARSA